MVIIRTVKSFNYVAKYLRFVATSVAMCIELCNMMEKFTYYWQLNLLRDFSSS
jgi:hypothetical protein